MHYADITSDFTVCGLYVNGLPVDSVTDNPTQVLCLECRGITS